MSIARDNAYIIDNLQRVLQILNEKPLKFITYNLRFNFLNIEKPITIFALLTTNDYFYSLGMTLNIKTCLLNDCVITTQYFRCREASAYYNTKALDNIFGSFSYYLLNRNLCLGSLELNQKLYDLAITLVKARIKKYKLLMANHNE
jgi:hypothetical protein